MVYCSIHDLRGPQTERRCRQDLHRMPHSSAWSYTSLFAGGKPGLVYDVSDFSSMTIGRDGSGGAPGIGDVVGKRFDLSGNGNHAVMPADDARPRLLLDAGGRPYLDYDGVNDGWSVNVAGIPDNCSIFTALDPNDGASGYYLYTDGATANGIIVYCASQAQPVSVNCGTPAYRVDGVTLPPPVYRSHMLSALTATGLPHVVSIIGADVSAWTDFGFARVPTRMMPGRDYGTIIVRASDIDATDIANIESWLAGQSGAVLPS